MYDGFETDLLYDEVSAVQAEYACNQKVLQHTQELYEGTVVLGYRQIGGAKPMEDSERREHIDVSADRAADTFQRNGRPTVDNVYHCSEWVSMLGVD